MFWMCVIVCLFVYLFMELGLSDCFVIVLVDYIVVLF